MSILQRLHDRDNTVTLAEINSDDDAKGNDVLYLSV